MANCPNFLFLMADQMQGRVLDPASACRTPCLDALARDGTRFPRAYTPNAVCSPARASLMTGLLPHNHGVQWVTHTMAADQGVLRTAYPHWAQALRGVGYRTAYFGKWHVEHGESPSAFGWEKDGSMRSPAYSLHRGGQGVSAGQLEDWILSGYYENRPPGYARSLFYGVTRIPPRRRNVGLITSLAAKELASLLRGTDPWCCFVSVPEPHDPFVAGEEAFSLYDPARIPVPPNWNDDLAGRPGIYARAASIWEGIGMDDRRTAAACYYASITEIDAEFGRLIDMVRSSAQARDTVVILTSDHGELLGAHGMYCKNFSASEEIYNIPLVIAGPGVGKGAVCPARVGLHDLYPTILDVAAAGGPRHADSLSFAPLLTGADPGPGRSTGYAEYSGGRYLLTQRILWDGDWKLVFNGFDRDELYDLGSDPWELCNRAADPACADVYRRLMLGIWRIIRDTGDRTLLESQYPILRIAKVGPEGCTELTEGLSMR